MKTEGEQCLSKRVNTEKAGSKVVVVVGGAW